MGCVPEESKHLPPWTRDEVFDNHVYLPGYLRSYNLLDGLTAKKPEDVEVRYDRVYGAYIGIEQLLQGQDTPEATEAKRRAKAWARFQEPYPLKPR